MKEIKLTQNKVALVDDDDFDFINQWKWQTVKCIHTNYAVCKCKGVGYSALMHRLIMKTPKGLVVDHLDHNGLNNQKSNLKNCTQLENCKNTIRKIPVQKLLPESD